MSTASCRAAASRSTARAESPASLASSGRCGRSRRLFRRLFLAGLEAAFQRGELRFSGDLEPLAEPHAFAERVRSLRQSERVGYLEPPFGGPAHVLAYLARYTRRSPIRGSSP